MDLPPIPYIRTHKIIIGFKWFCIFTLAVAAIQDLLDRCYKIYMKSRPKGRKKESRESSLLELNIIINGLNVFVLQDDWNQFIVSSTDRSK